MSVKHALGSKNRSEPRPAAFSNFHLPGPISYPAPMHWQKISLIGVGLLGGSLGLAIKQRRLAGRVEGYVRRADSVAECQRLAVVDAATLDLRAAVTDADLIILCTPIGQMREVSARMASSVRPGAIVTDVGSVKASVIQELEPLFAGAGAAVIRWPARRKWAWARRSRSCSPRRSARSRPR